jgi:uncharacterized protein YeaO (DUF488 family)
MASHDGIAKRPAPKRRQSRASGPSCFLKTKSVQSPASPDDGWRILAARFRGRGLPKDRYDVWMPNLAPSEVLLRKFQQGAVTWSEFSQAYREQMAAGGPADEENATVKDHGQKFTLRLLQAMARKQPVTLLCHCAEDEQHCHRHLLKALIERV